MLVGRLKEKEVLNSILTDGRSHFLAVYGRRRIGKTFLIREFFGYRFTFQHSGIYGAGLKAQLFAFSSSLKDSGSSSEQKPGNWLEAFEGLKQLIRESKETKKVVFIDELSWMDTARSDLMPALENFWNGFASARKDVIFIVCASATSWMLSNIIHSKGGLYNRLTEQIHLQAFSLRECEQFVRSENLLLNRLQILQYYMVFGGIPYYWGFLKKGCSLAQNIDRILFSRDAPLQKEFEYIYSSVFKKPAVYIRIIETLGTKRAGMTREELIRESGIVNSGDLSTKLEELESCGFIRKYSAYGMKKKNSVYQLIDFFTLFYFRFLKNKPTDEHFWTNQINTPAVNTWMGLAFERVCMEHVRQIKFSLGISGVLTETNSWYCKADPDRGISGSQIDMLIVRQDQIISLCEMKYSANEYTVSEEDEKSITRKVKDLILSTGTRYAVFPTLVTPFGMVLNVHSNVIQSVVTLEDLFGGI